MIEIAGREYLQNNNSENYEMYKDLYFGDHYKHFPIDEFEFSLNEKNYIAYNIIGFGVDTLTNLYGINKATFDFGNNELNNIFEDKRKQIDFDEKIEIMIRDYRIYGNAYVTIINNNIENINPAIVYADYNSFNLGMEAKKYTIVYEKELKNNQETYLLIDYLEGAIVLSAYLEENETYRQVFPIDYFPEILENVENNKDEVIVIQTGLNTSSIIALHGTQKNSFYGRSQINSSVLSLQELVNKMGNLAKFVVSNNSVPRLKLSEESSKILQSIIDESPDSIPQPTKLTSIPNRLNNSFNNVSWAFSSIVAKMGKKLMFFRENGRGNTEYLINNYKLDDLFRLQNESEQKLLRELKVSPALYNTDLTSGNLGSGIAYKRLLQMSIQEVENMRIKSQDQISKIAQTLMQLELNNNVPLPELIFQPVVEDEIENNVENNQILTNSDVNVND